MTLSTQQLQEIAAWLRGADFALRGCAFVNAIPDVTVEAISNSFNSSAEALALATKAFLHFLGQGGKLDFNSPTGIKASMRVLIEDGISNLPSADDLLTIYNKRVGSAHYGRAATHAVQDAESARLNVQQYVAAIRADIRLRIKSEGE